MPDNRSPTADDGQIGRLIRQRREALGLSQTELGQAVGVTFQQIQKYEKGINRVAVSRLSGLAEALQVPRLHFYPEHKTHTLSSEALRLATEVDKLRSGHRAAIFALAEALLRDQEQQAASTDLAAEGPRAEPRRAQSPEADGQ